jgi:hypothetical protein
MNYLQTGLYAASETATENLSHRPEPCASIKLLRQNISPSTLRSTVVDVAPSPPGKTITETISKLANIQKK